ncbi:metallo-beta-lactamase family protein [Catalinimonas alkaloidigena]|uniref:Metallo-beta-lactamase family protein n=1 Tax=Catalinimonas alkaloidigena TaxID=1075417 RepID=A0A1G9BTN4_9BACT|nr:MBL fold metallo-hydrolase [Catalinimonas alkaloidigena]SDK42797.1 metallo-beta-lactamase family protein [Catalinimonas alkaloidigena]
MKLTFWGAARQVTGSMYLLELASDYRILIDCGADMEREEVPSTMLPYRSVFPFEPSMVNLVLLTHAHIDHSGNLPNLVRDGYEGQILCTAPTMALSELLLHDAAALNRRRLNKIHGGKRRKHNKPKIDTTGMYLESHVKETMERFVTLAFHQRFRVSPQLAVTFIPAGHLLGAAHILLEITENGETKTLAFSGDLGRKNYPLLVDPEPLPEVDYLVCESTYGNRRHQATQSPETIMADVIKRTCVDMPGRLIIPAFSIGRTQALLYTLNQLNAQRGFPSIPVFADSPLALRSTRVYERFTRQLNQEAQEFHEDYEELFDFSNLHYVEDLKRSRAISNYLEPSIIISSSGMVSGGRVEQHIQVNLGNPYCTILMIGYAAEGTIGHQLVRGDKQIKMGKQELTVQAHIETTDVFSGHGDLDDLLDFVKHQKPDRLKKVFLSHGEYPDAMENFRSELQQLGYDNVEIPAKGQSFQL